MLGYNPSVTRLQSLTRKTGGFGVQGSPEQREMGDIVEVVRLHAIAVSFSCTLAARREAQHWWRIDVAARRRGGRCDGR
jgi:hypothetical protein